MSHYVYEATPTPTAGYWAGTTLDIFASLMNQVLVTSATDTTTFDVKITDAKSRVIQEFTDIKGIVNDLTPLPTIGVHIVEIDNASADEAFSVKFVFDEGH